MEERITLKMMDGVLGSNFELMLYEDETEEMRRVVVSGPEDCGRRREIGELCERIGLDKDTKVGSLFLNRMPAREERLVARLIAKVDEGTVKRIGRMVLNGEVPGRVSPGWNREGGGGGDASGTI